MNAAKKNSPKKKSAKTLRILHVGNHTIPCVGGIEKVIWDLARTHARAGHSVHVLVFDECTRGAKLPAHESREGVEIHRLPCQRILFYRKPEWKKVLPFVQAADVVHVHGFGGWLDQLVRHRDEFDAKLILTTHGGFFHTPQRAAWKRAYQTLLLPRIWEGLDALTYVSANDQHQFPAPSSVIARVIPNGIDLAPLLKIGARAKKKTEFVFVGRLSRNKGIDQLIRVFGEMVPAHPEWKLHIIGEDWEAIRPELESIIRQKSLAANVTLHGKISDGDVRKFYSRSAFFISASKYEGFGISAIEAMAAGCIPLLNRIPTFEEFVSRSAGLCVDFDAPDAAARIAGYVEGLSTLRPSIITVQTYSRSFDLEKISDAYLQLYADAGAR